jgi:hypothetical protein
MSSTTTPRLALIKPTVGDDNDHWGIDLNANFDVLDTKVATVTISPSAPASPTAGDFWWNSSTIGLYLYYSSAWVSTAQGTVTSIVAGSGLNGGTISTSGTLSLASSGVSAGAYGDATHVPRITLDAFGRVTAASSVAITSSGVQAITAGSGITVTGSLVNETITNAGVLQLGTATGTVALSSNLAVSGGTLALAGTIAYALLPAEVQQVPVSLGFSGKPAAAAVINVPMPWSIVVPASLAGTVCYDSTQATANTAFVINRISGGTTVAAIGTVTVTPTSHTSCTLSGTGGTLSAGDVLQCVAPGIADATLSDIAISVLCNRV